MAYVGAVLNMTLDNVSKHLKGTKKIYSYEVLSEKEYMDLKEFGLAYIEEYTSYFEKPIDLSDISEFNGTDFNNLNNFYYRLRGFRLLSNFKFTYVGLENNTLIKGNFRDNFQINKYSEKAYNGKDKIFITQDYLINYNSMTDDTVPHKQLEYVKKNNIVNIVARNKDIAYFKLFSFINFSSMLNVINSYRKEVKLPEFIINTNTPYLERTRLIGKCIGQTIQLLYKKNYFNRNTTKINKLFESYSRYKEIRNNSYDRMNYDYKKDNDLVQFDKMVDDNFMDLFEAQLKDNKLVLEKLKHFDFINVTNKLTPESIESIVKDNFEYLEHSSYKDMFSSRNDLLLLVLNDYIKERTKVTYWLLNEVNRLKDTNPSVSNIILTTILNDSMKDTKLC
jgi:hypothetical protein